MPKTRCIVKMWRVFGFTNMFQVCYVRHHQKTSALRLAKTHSTMHGRRYVICNKLIIKQLF